MWNSWDGSAKSEERRAKKSPNRSKAMLNTDLVGTYRAQFLKETTTGKESTMRSRIRSGDFEQLIVWQKAAVITELIHEMTSQGVFSKDYWFKIQIRSAGISISSNIAEGFGPYSDKEFMRFLSIARKVKK
jgi:hypothetical protein